MGISHKNFTISTKYWHYEPLVYAAQRDSKYS